MKQITKNNSGETENVWIPTYAFTRGK